MKWLCKLFGHKWDYRYEKCGRCGLVNARKTSDDVFDRLAVEGYDVRPPDAKVQE